MSANLASTNYYSVETTDKQSFDLAKTVKSFFEDGNTQTNALEEAKVVEILKKYVDNFSSTTVRNILFAVSGIVSTDFRAYTITDLDEVIFNPMARHIQRYNDFFAAQRQRLADLSNPASDEFGYLLEIPQEPTFEEVCAVGGTHAAYAVYGDHYKKLNEEARNDLEFNRGLDFIDDNISGYAHAIKNLAPFYAALTTRPESIQELTEKEVGRVSLDIVLPVITRPTDIHIAQTHIWKFNVLMALAELSNKTIIMLDDQLDLFNLIQEENHPLIKGILFAGPITKPHEEATSWPNLEKKVRSMVN
ncbi:MAG: hypothetical protein LBG64_02530 [Pseudomonadales bacterium]|jgi:hypothetical protein|nr:hypothetical protein [Pseudomonadales bacterium]